MAVGFLPDEDKKIRGMFRGRPVEYLAAIKIRGAAITAGNELKRNFPGWKHEAANYAVLNYIQRLQLLGTEKGNTQGILIEWEEVRIGDHCLKTLLKVQSLANDIQSAEEGRLVRHAKCPEKENRKTRNFPNKWDMED